MAFLRILCHFRKLFTVKNLLRSWNVSYFPIAGLRNWFDECCNWKCEHWLCATVHSVWNGNFDGGTRSFEFSGLHWYCNKFTPMGFLSEWKLFYCHFHSVINKNIFRLTPLVEDVYCWFQWSEVLFVLYYRRFHLIFCHLLYHVYSLDFCKYSLKIRSL